MKRIYQAPALGAWYEAAHISGTKASSRPLTEAPVQRVRATIPPDARLIGRLDRALLRGAVRLRCTPSPRGGTAMKCRTCGCAARF